MRKLLWMILLFCTYIWVITSGHDEFLLEKGKEIYQALVAWFDDAEVDFHLQREKHSKQKTRRWE